MCIYTLIRFDSLFAVFTSGNLQRRIPKEKQIRILNSKSAAQSGLKAKAPHCWQLVLCDLPIALTCLPLIREQSEVCLSSECAPLESDSGTVLNPEIFFEFSLYKWDSRKLFYDLWWDYFFSVH